MGLFNDYHNTNRDNWKFSYLGQELAVAARKKYEQFTGMELADRTKMADLLRDPNVRASDPKIEELKVKIEKHGTQREKCMVWVHEFERTPTREFLLNLGDVTYFDLALTPKISDPPKQSDPITPDMSRQVDFLQIPTMRGGR